MSLFKKCHIEMAKKNSSTYLERKYQKTENQLRYYARVGDMKKFKQAMKDHECVEYAMLYQFTPGFKKRK